MVTTLAEARSENVESADDPTEGPPRPRSQSRFAWWIAAAVVVSFALHVAIGMTDDAPSTDETAYLGSGVSLVSGDGFERGGSPELHFPPFIPLLLGLGSKVFADPHVGAVWLTIVAGTAVVVPLALLARRLAGDRAGMATAWLAALLPAVAVLPANRGAGSEAMYVLLLVTAVWLVVAAHDVAPGRPRTSRLLAAGGCVGLAYLSRPEGLFMAVPLAAAIAILAWRRATPSPSSARAGIGVAGKALAAFAVPIVLCIVPYAAYLHSHTDRWQLTAKTQDASIEAWHAVAGSDREGRDKVLYELDETGYGLKAEMSSLTSLALDDPGEYVGIVRTNVGQLFDMLVLPESEQFLAWLIVPLPVWALVVAGVWRHRRSATMRLLLAVAALPVATCLMFFVQPRYLMVTATLAAVPAGAALAAVPWPTRRWVAAATAVLLVLSTAQAFKGPGGWWHPADHTDQRDAGTWLADHAAPGDRVMTRSLIIGYYAERPALAIPYADLETIVDFGQHYGAQYLVVDWYTAFRLRPQLRPLQKTDAFPGLRLVHEVRREGRTTRIFAFDPAPSRDAPMGPSVNFTGDS